ncbi:hypothetical protein LZ32DRAFT_613512 [Colletotrichum eremochloae]|nr:hypothetical protein LZ32DRAFT_613512 [Colletotrichum eremochloae]
MIDVVKLPIIKLQYKNVRDIIRIKCYYLLTHKLQPKDIDNLKTYTRHYTSAMKASIISLAITLTSALVAARPQSVGVPAPIDPIARCTGNCASSQCGSIGNVLQSKCDGSGALLACSCKS